MPYRPPVHNAVAARAPGARVHRVEGSPSRKGLYDHDWRKLRAAFLMQHPLCVFCQDAGLVTTATQVDHIKTIRDCPELRLDWDNLRGLCDSHHAARTWADQRGRAPASPHPPWLRSAQIPVTVVCGPPAAGKSTWVAERAVRGDLVLDLDGIVAELRNAPVVEHGWDRARWLQPALRLRNQRLGALSARPVWPRAWLIVAEPKAEWRQWWWERLRPARIVVLATPDAVCVARAAAQGRDRSAALVRDGVRDWWAAYTPRPGDDVVIAG